MALISLYQSSPNDPKNLFANIVPPLGWGSSAYDIYEARPSIHSNGNGEFGFDINVRAGLDSTAVASVGDLKGPYTVSGPVNVRPSL